MTPSNKRSGGSVFKDRSKLDFDFVPKNLPHRDSQMEELSMLFRPVLSGGKQTVFMTGSVGTGKTAVAKLFSDRLAAEALKTSRRVDPVYVNCRMRPGDKAVLLQILRHYQKHFPDRGFSTSEMLDTLGKSMAKQGSHLLVILDEADILLKRGTELIYQLSRFDEESGSTQKSVSMILVSQQDIFPLMDSASASTFGRTSVVNFGKYTQKELFSIVSQRIDLAFKPGLVEPGVEELIADIASDWGDARYAIELLLKAGMSSDEEHRGEVIPEDVRAAKACTHNVITKDKFSDLDLHKSMVLLACSRLLKSRAYVKTGEVERSYAVVCEEYSEEARKHTQFWKYVKDLEALGLLDTKVSHGPEGTTTMITIRDIPAKVLEDKIVEKLRRHENGKKKA